MGETKEPPALPGEVWRGTMTLPSHAQPAVCALTEDGTPWWRQTWRGGGEWVRAFDVGDQRAVVSAAFTAERARAEKAEAKLAALIRATTDGAVLGVDP